MQFLGDTAWYLHNTHGFPIELTSMLAEERNLSIDLDRFEECRNQAKVILWNNHFVDFHLKCIVL